MTLRAKVLLPLLLLGAVLAAAGGYVAHRSSRGALEAWMIDRARLIASAVASAADSPSPQSEIRRVVDSLVRFEGVSEIVVVAGDPPRVIATNVATWLDLPLTALPGRAVADDLRRALETRSDSYDLEHADGTLIDYTAPFGPLAIDPPDAPSPAAVMVHLSSKSLEVESAIAARRSIAWSAAGVFAMTAAALAVLGYFVLRPTSAIVATLESRSAGARNARAALDADDEIGAVAAALNAMLDAIEREEALRREVEAQNRRLLEQLRSERDRAQAGERAKTEFLATMSHEIRTPMNGILGFADLLRETELAQDQREYVTALRRSARSLLALLDDILDFSKIEAGRMTMDSAPFDLARIAEEVAELFLEPCAKKDIDLVVAVEPDAPIRLVGDPDRVRQVLSNLVGNAVKFTASGLIRIVVRRDPDAVGPVARPRVEVHDTGIGIPDEARPRLFQRFQQGDVSTTRRYGGSGLGLAICKRLVEQMGGAIGIESEPGAGSTFWFTLALPHDPSPTRRDDRLPLPPRDDAVARRLLIVTTRDAVYRALEHGAAPLGFSCEHAADLPAALAALEPPRSRGVLALIVDSHLAPAGAAEGLEPLLARATELGARRVALIRPQERREVDRAGFDACLCEPIVRRDELREALAGSDRPEAQTPERKNDTLPRRRLRVLVAEDNPVNQKLVRLMLDRLGCDVELANDGDEAVDRATGSRYDLILMDCQMPGLDGFEAARRIRSGGGASSAVPIVALTANAMAEDRARCLAAGMDDYLAKPFRFEDLRAVLARRAADSPE